MGRQVLGAIGCPHNARPSRPCRGGVSSESRHLADSSRKGEPPHHPSSSTLLRHAGLLNLDGGIAAVTSISVSVAALKMLWQRGALGARPCSAVVKDCDVSRKVVVGILVSTFREARPCLLDRSRFRRQCAREESVPPNQLDRNRRASWRLTSRLRSSVPCRHVGSAGFTDRARREGQKEDSPTPPPCHSCRLECGDAVPDNHGAFEREKIKANPRLDPIKIKRHGRPGGKEECREGEGEKQVLTGSLSP